MLATANEVGWPKYALALSISISYDQLAIAKSINQETLIKLSNLVSVEILSEKKDIILPET